VNSNEFIYRLDVNLIIFGDFGGICVRDVTTRKRSRRKRQPGEIYKVPLNVLEISM
jgi:hypothetical protein